MVSAFLEICEQWLLALGALPQRSVFCSTFVIVLYLVLIQCQRFDCGKVCQRSLDCGKFFDVLVYSTVDGCYEIVELWWFSILGGVRVIVSLVVSEPFDSSLCATGDRQWRMWCDGVVASSDSFRRSLSNQLLWVFCQSRIYYEVVLVHYLCWWWWWWCLWRSQHW